MVAFDFRASSRVPHTVTVVHRPQTATRANTSVQSARRPSVECQAAQGQRQRTTLYHVRCRRPQPSHSTPGLRGMVCTWAVAEDSIVLIQPVSLPQFGYCFLVLTSQRLLENLARAEAIIAQNRIATQTTNH